MKCIQTKNVFGERILGCYAYITPSVHCRAGYLPKNCVGAPHTCTHHVAVLVADDADEFVCFAALVRADAGVENVK